jgi:hypothetical protein
VVGFEIDRRLEGPASHDRETEGDLLPGGCITCGWESGRKSGTGSGDKERDGGEGDTGSGVITRGDGEGDQETLAGYLSPERGDPVGDGDLETRDRDSETPDERRDLEDTKPASPF